jgi:hypothetical protein
MFGHKRLGLRTEATIIIIHDTRLQIRGLQGLSTMPAPILVDLPRSFHLLVAILPTPHGALPPNLHYQTVGWSMCDALLLLPLR